MSSRHHRFYLLLISYREGKKCLTLAARFLHLETPGLPSCCPSPLTALLAQAWPVLYWVSCLGGAPPLQQLTGLSGRRFFFRSGNIEHPEDKLFNTSVEVLPFDVSVVGGGCAWRPAPPTATGFSPWILPPEPPVRQGGPAGGPCGHPAVPPEP